MVLKSSLVPYSLYKHLQKWLRNLTLVRDYSLYNSIQFDDLFEIEMGNERSIITLLTRHKVSHIGEPTNDYYNSIMTPLGSWKSNNKFHTYIFPRLEAPTVDNKSLDEIDYLLGEK